jgi:serine/threonine-protein kinase HipA
MARSLDVYLHQHFVGLLIQDIHGEMGFQYAASWLADPDAMALSHSLPLRAEAYSRRECRGFFGGILPEGSNREIVARNLGISAKNDIAMLERIGGECGGAVTFLPSGESLSARQDHYRPLSDHDLADALRALPRRPLLAGDKDVRLSLAGAQDKLAVFVAQGQISLPLGGAPSTHILKPAIGLFHGLTINEWLCMRLARAVGLPTASVEMGSVEGIDYLLVERYDRIHADHGPPARLHQEDFCQALGIVSENKYQNEGGPSMKQCFQLLRDASSVPAIDIGRLLDAILFNFLIGNNDAHGKNFSLLYPENAPQSRGTSMAPLYDLVCTVYYPELSQRMAMKLGGEYEAARIFPRHFDRFAEEAGLGKPMVKRRIQALAKSITSKLPEITPENPVGIGVANRIRSQCESVVDRIRG